MLNQFAEKYKVKVKKDECGDSIIVGSRLSNIYDGFADETLGLIVRFETARKYNGVRSKLLTAGFVQKQNGATEGCFKFDPTNAQQAKLALKLVGARVRRELSPAQLSAISTLAARRRAPKEVPVGA